jgi:predicted RNase H-like HicB family nuclease
MSKLAFPLTFLLKREGRQWAALCPEIGIASCGETQQSAKEALEDAIATYVTYLVGAGRPGEISRQASPEEVEDFLADPPGEHKAEGMVLIMELERGGCGDGSAGPHLEFIPSLAPAVHAVSGASAS